MRAAWAIPLLDDIGDFAWEAIFHYVKGLRMPDPLRDGQSKKLFDAVDSKTGTGWSLKALQLKRKELPPSGFSFYFVIQRASILKEETKKSKKSKANNQEVNVPTLFEIAVEPIKEEEIAVPKVTLDSKEEDIGHALLNFWNNKVTRDMEAQKVKDGRLCILLKNHSRQQYMLVECPIPLFDPEKYQWQWSEGHRGLHGTNIDTQDVELKWYHGQTQFFQKMRIPEDAPRVVIEPVRLQEAHQFINDMLELLTKQAKSVKANYLP